MTLEPGYYKVKYGSGMNETYHLLRVFQKNGKRYYQLDHAPKQRVDKETARDMHYEGFSIIKKFTVNSPPKYSKIKARVEFEDEEGCKFEMVASSGIVLDSIFEMFPRLKKNFWT